MQWLVWTIDVHHDKENETRQRVKKKKRLELGIRIFVH